MADRSFDPYYEWLGIQPSEQPANFYRLLGIAKFEDNAKVIERAADRQMGYLRQFQTKHPAEVSQILSRLALARITLTDRQKKLDYDKSLNNGHAQVRSGTPEPIADPPGDSWYVQLSGICQGPFTTAEMQARIRAREVREDSLVRNGKSSAWVLARQVPGLFDFTISAPPPPGTLTPKYARLEPVAKSSDPLLGPMPEPEDRTPGPNVWICRKCRWPVPRPKIHCPRCGHVKKVNDSGATEKTTLVMLLLIMAALSALLFVVLVTG